MYSSHGSDWGWGTRSYTLKDDVTVVGRYGDPWWNGGGTIRINDENGKEILYHTDHVADRKSLIYRCKKGMTLYGDGGGDDGGVACWNILGNYHVVVKNTKGEVVKEDDLDVETAQYDVYMSDGVKKIGSFYYSGYSWKIIK